MSHHVKHVEALPTQAESNILFTEQVKQCRNSRLFLGRGKCRVVQSRTCRAPQMSPRESCDKFQCGSDDGGCSRRAPTTRSHGPARVEGPQMTPEMPNTPASDKWPETPCVKVRTLAQQDDQCRREALNIQSMVQSATCGSVW